MRVRTVCSLALSMTVVGCSIHPLPKDVTRDTTIEIVNKIRCETRRAIVGQIMDEIEEASDAHGMIPRGNAMILNVLHEHGTSEEVFCNLPRIEKILHKDTLRNLNKFRGSTIVYNFNFKITEDKQKAGSVKFEVPFFKGNFKLGLDASSKKVRVNERNVDLQDSFSSLVYGFYNEKEDTGLMCDLVSKPRKHWIYPITGKIGMEEVVNTYIEAHSFTKSLDTFTDKLTFTTKFSFGANPSVTLSRIIPRKFNLTEAKIDYDKFRQDIHEVELLLKQYKEPEKKTSHNQPAEADLKILDELVKMDTSKVHPENRGLAIALMTPKKPKPKPEQDMIVTDHTCPALAPTPEERTAAITGVKPGMRGHGAIALPAEAEKASRQNARDEADRQQFISRSQKLLDLIE